MTKEWMNEWIVERERERERDFKKLKLFCVVGTHAEFRFKTCSRKLNGKFDFNLASRQTSIGLSNDGHGVVDGCWSSSSSLANCIAANKVNLLTGRLWVVVQCECVCVCVVVALYTSIIIAGSGSLLLLISAFRVAKLLYSRQIKQSDFTNLRDTSRQQNNMLEIGQIKP